MKIDGRVVVLLQTVHATNGEVHAGNKQFIVRRFADVHRFPANDRCIDGFVRRAEHSPVMMQSFVEIFEIQMRIAEVAVRAALPGLIVAFLGVCQTLQARDRGNRCRQHNGRAYFLKVLNRG